MTIGQRISRLRKERLLSQEDMADKIGVSRQAVSKWETDACAPDAYNLIALAETLNTSVEYIVMGKSSVEVQEKTVENMKPRDIHGNLAILGFILLAGGFIMAFIGMFLHEIWCIIGGYIAATGIVFATARTKKTFCIAFSVMAVLIVVTILLLTL